jgi:hypothetical protein
MARSRRQHAPQASQQAPPSNTVVPNQTNNEVVQTTQGERKQMAGELSPEQIQALLASSTTRGQYARLLHDFVSSGSGAVDVMEQWPTEFASDKNRNTIKQGFENAKNGKNAPEGSAGVRVIKNEEKVYLVNQASAAVRAAQGQPEPVEA